ncbi:Putative cytochrome P450 superfamily protein, partial [Zea mays]
MLRDLSAAPSGEVVMRRVLHAASLDHVMATVFGARYDAASPEGAELEEMVKEGYVRPARLVQLGRPPAVAQVAGPARRQEEVQEPGEQSEVFVARIIEEHRRKKKEAASGESVAGASSTSCWDWRARRSCRTPTLAEILGDDLSRHRHGRDPAGVGDGADGAAPGHPVQGAGGAGRRRGSRPRVRRRCGPPALPPARRKGDAPRAPARPAAVVGAPGRARRGGRRPPGPRRHHGHGEHVGDRARPRGVAGALRVPPRAVRGGGRERAGRRPARVPWAPAGACAPARRWHSPLSTSGSRSCCTASGGRRRTAASTWRSDSACRWRSPSWRAAARVVGHF